MFEEIASIGRRVFIWILLVNIIVSIFSTWLIVSGFDINKPPLNAFVYFKPATQTFAQASQMIAQKNTVNMSTVIWAGTLLNYALFYLPTLIFNIAVTVLGGGVIAICRLAFMYDPLLGILVSIPLMFLQFCTWFALIVCFFFRRC